MALELAGFANVHSHAFQRRMRGAVHHRDPASSDTFWTWRERMYEEAAGLDPAAVEASARLCYAECLEAGYTAVGEFHYVHHRADGSPHPGDPVATSRAILAAARQTGIRLCLLYTVYARGGFGAPLSPRQRRFGSDSLDDVRRALDTLAPLVSGPKRRLGIAIHSVRAVPPEWLDPLAREATARDLLLHAHVAEQPAEVEACLAATGRRPVALLADHGVLGARFTAVHATHLDDADIALLADSGATVALCPSTEGDLGDGVPRTADLHEAGVPLAIGSDSHAVIDPFTELRFVEYQARAATGRRCVVTDASGRVVPELLRVGHDHGYRCLGLEASGDRVRLRADARALAGSSDPLGAAVMAGHPGLVDGVWVAGEQVVRDGRHIARS